MVYTELESSGDYSTKPQLKDLFMPSSPPIWTIATPSLPCLPASLFLIFQNTAARMITLTRKHDHISLILRSLHWLPVHSRITFKILLFVYKITHNVAPKYLQDLVSLRSSSCARFLRSSSSMQLIHGPRTKTRYGDRAFSILLPPPSGTNSHPIFKMPHPLNHLKPF